MTECRIANDPFAEFVCDYFRVSRPDLLEAFDEGWEETRFEPSGSSWRPVRKIHEPDASVEAVEVYQILLRSVPDLMDPRHQESHRRVMERHVAVIRSSLERSGQAAGSRAYDRAFGRALFALFTLPPARGGLGIRFDTRPGGTRSPADVYRERLATCLEFVGFYREAAEIAGIRAVPLELFEDSGGTEMHVGIGFYDASGQLAEVGDFNRTIRFGAPLGGQVWSPVSSRELLAYYYNARAIRSADPARRAADFDFALRLSPGNYLVLFNQAYYALENGNAERARDLLLRSIRANPLHRPSYYNLNTVALRLGDTRLAERAWDRYASPSSVPF